MKYLILFAMLISILVPIAANSTQSTSEDREVKKALDAIAAKNRPTPLLPVDCDLAEMTGTPTSNNCLVPEKVYDNTKMFVMKFKNYNEIPDSLKKELPEFTEAAKLREIHVTVGLTNDSGLGFIGVKGDDQGMTTSSRFAVGGTTASGTELEVSATGNLYTKVDPESRRVVDGVKVGNQKFRNETILEIMANNMKAGKLSYYDARAGIVNVSSNENFGILDGSFQQREFHQFLNRIAPGSNREYTYENDGQKDKWGAYFKMMVGMQYHAKMGTNCVVSAYAAVGAQASTMDQSSYVEAAMGLEGRYNLKSGSVKAGVGVTTKAHSGGQLTTVSAKLAYEYKKKLEAGLIISASAGNLMNGDVTYNNTNVTTNKIDPTAMLYVKVYTD